MENIYDQHTTRNEPLIDLCIADILTSRFRKIVKEKNINIDEFAKQLGSWWFLPIWDRRTFPDGSFDAISLNRFKQFLEFETLYLPGKEYLRRLEARLGYEQDEVCTNFKENLSTNDFLYACGYLNEKGQLTRKFKNSPRIKLYHKKKEQEQIDRHRAAAESQKFRA